MNWSARKLFVYIIFMMDPIHCKCIGNTLPCPDNMFSLCVCVSVSLYNCSWLTKNGAASIEICVQTMYHNVLHSYTFNALRYSLCT